MKTLIFLILINISLKAQPKTINYSNWLFGFKAGITFNTPDKNPIEIKDNIYALNTQEGISTISDDNGNLILSCNGIHLVHFVQTKNGLNYKIFEITKFKQFESSTNSNIILPSLENKNQYYVFYAGDIADYNKFVYRIFDISLNNGQGDWAGDFELVYNEFISEKITAIYDYNNNHYWVVTTEKDNDSKANILLFKIDEQGVDLSPKKFKLPFNTDQYGDIKFSPDGKYLALCESINNTLLVYEFNFKSAILNKIIEYTNINTRVLSAEFSPKMNYIYTVERDIANKTHQIYQYNFSTRNQKDFIDSQVTLQIANPKYEYLHLENGSNGKIYATTYDYTRVPFNYDFNFLTVIENPDERSDFLQFNFLNFTGGRHPNIGLITKPTIINENYTKCIPELSIYLEDRTLNLGDDFCVNGTMIPKCSDSTYLKDINISLRYNPRLMKFKSSSLEYNLEENSEYNIITLRFEESEINLDEINNFSLCFTSMLGESLYTTIEVVDSKENNQDFVISDSINSNIQFVSCDQTFRLIELITLTDFEVILINKSLKISLSTSEEGTFTFILVDINGNIIKKEKYSTSKDNYFDEEIFQIDLSDISTGVYNIRMTSPSGKYYTKRIMIVD